MCAAFFLVSRANSTSMYQYNGPLSSISYFITSLSRICILNIVRSAQAFCQNRLFNTYFFFSAVASFILVSVGLLFIFVLPISSLCRSFPFVAVLYFDFIYLYCFICLSIFVLRLYSLTALCFQCNISNCR